MSQPDDNIPLFIQRLEIGFDGRNEAVRYAFYFFRKKLREETGKEPSARKLDSRRQIPEFAIHIMRRPFDFREPFAFRVMAEFRLVEHRTSAHRQPLDYQKQSDQHCAEPLFHDFP
ncbi:MAG: hypothetical protein LBJ59_02975 [Zoogloeaceae bacterium]|jgi:hypothetical protein|nr:hypothetical protein [Zoogloeaceae bacterium]